jgi:hypothetical protein
MSSGSAFCHTPLWGASIFPSGTGRSSEEFNRVIKTTVTAENKMNGMIFINSFKDVK